MSNPHIFKLSGITAVISILILSLALGAACSKGGDGEAKKETETSVPVQVVVAGEGESGSSLIFTGVLDPANQTALTGKIAGTIQTVRAEVGDRVKKGAILAMLDQSNFNLSVHQAEAACNTAKLAADVAEADWKRIQNLKTDESVSQSDFEKAELGYRSTMNNLQQAEVGLEIARNYLADSVIRAPFDGQVIARMVSPGAHVDPMIGTVLFVVAETTRLRVTLKIPETRAQLVKAGDPVSVKVASAGRSFDAKIDVITDSVDPLTHTRTAVAWIDNKENPIAAGLFFEASITPDFLKGKILLPASSIREEGAKYFAYLVANDKAKRQEITGSYLSDRGHFITEGGVEAGAKIILEASMVRDGQSVTTAQAGKE
jgi:RND family efflux transporter MFP subunit